MTTVLMGCGLLEPEPTLRISGVVVAAPAFGGSPAGAPIGGARVQVMHRSGWDLSVSQLANTQADAAGAFQLEVGPPPHYAYPNCATMWLTAQAPGFSPSTHVGFGTSECPSVVEGVEIVLTPLEEPVITTTSLPPW
jgi:hypothetical protein